MTPHRAKKKSAAIATTIAILIALSGAAEKLDGSRAFWLKRDFGEFGLWCRHDGACFLAINGQLAFPVPCQFDFRSNGKPGVLAWEKLDGEIETAGDKTVVTVAGETNDGLEIVRRFEIGGGALTAEMTVRAISIAPKIERARFWNLFFAASGPMPFETLSADGATFVGDMKNAFPPIKKIRRIDVTSRDKRVAITLLDNMTTTLVDYPPKVTKVADWSLREKNEPWAPGHSERIRLTVQVSNATAPSAPR